MSKFFINSTLFAIIFLSASSALAREPAVRPADRMRTKWWWQGYYAPALPVEPVTQPCAEKGVRLAWTAWGGLAVQNNMQIPGGPTIGTDLEFCVRRYSDVNWAPSRVAFELSTGLNMFDGKLLHQLGAGIRYQLPAFEQFDGGFYWKYNYFSTFTADKSDDHHDAIFGLLGEFRPTYVASGEKQNSSGLYLTGRVGIGVDYHNRTASTRFMAEILLSAGYRFSGF